jgi:hypothetical protein
MPQGRQCQRQRQHADVARMLPRAHGRVNVPRPGREQASVLRPEQVGKQEQEPFGAGRRRPEDEVEVRARGPHREPPGLGPRHELDGRQRVAQHIRRREQRRGGHGRTPRSAGDALLHAAHEGVECGGDRRVYRHLRMSGHGLRADGEAGQRQPSCREAATTGRRGGRDQQPIETEEDERDQRGPAHDRQVHDPRRQEAAEHVGEAGDEGREGPQTERPREEVGRDAGQAELDQRRVVQRDGPREQQEQPVGGIEQRRLAVAEQRDPAERRRIPEGQRSFPEQPGRQDVIREEIPLHVLPREHAADERDRREEHERQQPQHEGRDERSAGGAQARTARH